MKSKKLFFLFFILLFSITLVQAFELPANLQKIADYNISNSQEFFINISFLIAFLAGILSILSPCILPFLPAYFSYTFKEKKNITLMSLVFFGGFTTVFLILGAIAGFIGEQSIIMLQKDWLITIAGIFIILFGFMALFNKGFSFIKFNNSKFSNDPIGIFLFGAAFAIGWTACVGPILSGILGIGAILNNMFYSITLMFFYSLGTFTLLFLLSIFHDKYNLEKYLKGKKYDFKIGERSFYVTTTSIISGILLVFYGLFLIIFKGTAVINGYDFFNTKKYFYLLQDNIMTWDYSGLLGGIILIIFIYFMYKRIKSLKNIDRN